MVEQFCVAFHLSTTLVHFVHESKPHRKSVLTLQYGIACLHDCTKSGLDEGL